MNISRTIKNSRWGAHGARTMEMRECRCVSSDCRSSPSHRWILSWMFFFHSAYQGIPKLKKMFMTHSPIMKIISNAHFFPLTFPFPIDLSHLSVQICIVCTEALRHSRDEKRAMQDKVQVNPWKSAVGIVECKLHIAWELCNLTKQFFPQFSRINWCDVIIIVSFLVCDVIDFFFN